MLTVSPRASSLSSRRFFAVFTGLLALLVFQTLAGATPANAQTQVDFDKVFSPDTIGPGSVSTLTFTITNNTSGGVRSLAFTDNLPTGMTIASPGNVSSTCFGGTISAPDGGSTISYSDGGVGSSSSCSITVDVTSSTVGVSTNTTGALTSDLGTHNAATDDLTVDDQRPGFSKSFSPSSVSFGGRSTLTFTINNSANNAAASNLNFTDNLPVGMTVASPANASKTCTGGTITATPGSSVISYSGFGIGAASVAALSSCSVSVDVRGNNIGVLGNTTGELTSTPPFGTARSSGKASAVLAVTQAAFTFTKEFTNDPVGPGGTVDLEFNITNLDRRNDATNISFDDDLDAVLSGLTFDSLLSNDCSGTVAGAGTTTITFSGGSLAVEGSCTIRVRLSVPAGATPGTYNNTTSAITADGGVTGNPATDALFIEASPPTLTKEFTDDPVTAGDPVTLTFTITNGSADVPLSDITFEDVFVEELPTASSVPANGSACGAGSVFTYTPLSNPPTPSSSVPAKLVVTGASLAAGASCTFSLVLDVAEDAANGTYPNVTSTITGLLDGETEVEGDPATDDLVVVAPPDISKEFTDDPVSPGSPVTLAFTITHSEDAPTDATDIAFTDDLTAMGIAGLESSSGTLSNVCNGTGTISGTDMLSFTGGTLAPGTSCTFSVSLAVPASAAAGSYFNETDNIEATVAELDVTGDTANDNLLIAPLTLEKEFTDDPVAPGGAVTLAFTLTNSGGPNDDATAIQFNDDLDDVLSGLVAAPPLSTGTCDGTLIGTSTLSYSGGTLAAGASCTFSVTLNVPDGATPDTYLNTTSGFRATIGGTLVSLTNASDELVVEDETASIVIKKEFTTDPVAPGGTVNLEFNIGYAGPSDATNIAFTDDLDAVVTGLVATGLPASACGGTVSTPDGGATLEFSGGTLTPGGSCTFSVSLTVPLGTPNGAYTNTTTEITAQVGTETVTGEPATDDVIVIGVSSNEPVANAGPDQTVECAAPEGASVLLDGSASVDPNGGVLTYTWTAGEDEEGNPIVIATVVNPTVTLSLGVHTITLTVMEPGGLIDTDQVVITINADTTAPVITLLGDNLLTLECAIDEYEDPGFTVVDACDANVEVIVGGAEVDPNTPGEYVVTYDATDAEGNAATQVTRTVTVEDTIAPVITLLGDNPLTLECPAAYVEPGATVVEACDVGLEATVGGDVVDPNTLGTYTVTYDAEDASGNTATQLTRTVEVVDTTPPVITLLGDDPLTLIRFSGPYVEPGATALDDCDGPVPVQITGTVDTNLPGSYVVTYDAVDAAGNPAQETRTVNVIDDPNALKNNFLFLSDKKIDLGDRLQVEGEMYSNDDVHLKKGPATYNGDVTAVEKIKIDDDVTVNGDLTAGDEVDLGNDVIINGTITEFANVPPLALPDLSFSAGETDITVEENQTLALAPGSYGKVEVKDDATLQLSTGAYFFEEFKIKKNVSLEIDLATGPVEINVEKDIDTDDNLTTTLSPLGDVDSRYVTFASLEEVTVEKGSVLVGQVIAPYGKVHFKENVTFRGSVCAEEVKADKDGVYAFHDAGVTAPLVISKITVGVVKEKNTEADAREVEAEAADVPDVAATVEAAEEAEVAADVEAVTPVETVEIAEAAEEVPAAYVLHGNYPNPFNPGTMIRFGVPEAAAVRLVVYDILGRQVRVLLDGVRKAGMHEVAFDATGLPSGTYLYLLETPQGNLSGTMLLMK